MSLTVLGIDPALEKTGIARGDITWTSKGGAGDQRLSRLFHDVKRMAWDADLAVIEDLPTHAMSAGLTGRAQGVVRMALCETGTPYVSIPPASLKKFATNNGAAKKPEMKAAMPLNPIWDNLTDDEVDAWWLREAGLYMLGLAKGATAYETWRKEALTGVNKKTKKPVIDWSPWADYLSEE